VREGVVQKHVSGDFAAAAAATRQIDMLYHEPHLFFSLCRRHLPSSYDGLANH
jgi:hypothetical protein